MTATAKKVAVSRGPKKPAAVTLSFTRAKETKGTFMFQEEVKDDAEPVVGNLYVKKHYFGEVVPENIQVTIRVP